MRCLTLVLAASLLAGVLAAPAGASDATVRQTLLAGVAAIRSSHDNDAAVLKRKLQRMLTALESCSGSTEAGRAARDRARRGFGWWLRGVRAQLKFHREDSGQVSDATRHARQADTFRRWGAHQLRLAGRALGLRIGVIVGF